jgi:hypothetical protein
VSPEAQQKLEQVKRYSASLRTVFRFVSIVVAFAGLVGLIIVLTVNDGQRIPSTIAFGGSSFAGDEITWMVKIAVALGMALSVGIALKLLHHLATLFDHYARGEIFTSDTVRQIRAIGVSVFLFVSIWLYGLLVQSILGVPAAVRQAAETGIDVRGWGIGVPEPLAVVLAGIMIIVVSWIMDVGRELREEQDLTV